MAGNNYFLAVPDDSDWMFFFCDVPDFAVAQVEHNIVDGRGGEGKGNIEVYIDDEVLEGKDDAYWVLK